MTIRTLIVNKLRECLQNPDEYVMVGFFQSYHRIIYKENCVQVNYKEIYSFLQSILPINYTQTAYSYIFVYIASLSIYRNDIETDHFTPTEERRLEESALFELAKAILNQAQLILNRDINYYEVYYLTIVLHSLPVTDYSRFDSVYPVELELLVNQLIIHVSEIMDYSFASDYELANLIINHTIPVIQRMKFDSQIKNPLTITIEQKYPAVHEAVRLAITHLESYVGIKMVPDELALFTLYFASSMEKLQMHKHPRNILVVCNSGNAVSRLLQYRLNNYFDVNILGFVAQSHLQAELKIKKPDLIISVLSQEVDDVDGIPVVAVSPLLTDVDLQNLKHHLNAIPEPDKREMQQLESELLKYLTPDMFAVDVEVKDHESLIRYSGSLLVKGQCANETYVESMISVTQRFGSLAHFLIAPNIILPHAGISENVFKTGFSFVKLNEAIFVNGQAIKVAIALCTTDKKSHEKAVLELGKLFNDAQFLKNIIEVRNYREFAQLVILTLGKEN